MALWSTVNNRSSQLGLRWSWWLLLVWTTTTSFLGIMNHNGAISEHIISQHCPHDIAMAIMMASSIDQCTLSWDMESDLPSKGCLLLECLCIRSLYMFLHEPKGHQRRPEEMVLSVKTVLVWWATEHGKSLPIMVSGKLFGQWRAYEMSMRCLSKVSVWDVCEVSVNPFRYFSIPL